MDPGGSGPTGRAPRSSTSPSAREPTAGGRHRGDPSPTAAAPTADSPRPPRRHAATVAGDALASGRARPGSERRAQLPPAQPGQAELTRQGTAPPPLAAAELRRSERLQGRPPRAQSEVGSATARRTQQAQERLRAVLGASGHGGARQGSAPPSEIEPHHEPRVPGYPAEVGRAARSALSPVGEQPARSVGGAEDAQLSGASGSQQRVGAQRRLQREGYTGRRFDQLMAYYDTLGEERVAVPPEWLEQSVQRSRARWRRRASDQACPGGARPQQSLSLRPPAAAEAPGGEPPAVWPWAVVEEVSGSDSEYLPSSEYSSGLESGSLASRDVSPACTDRWVRNSAYEGHATPHAPEAAAWDAGALRRHAAPALAPPVARALAEGPRRVPVQAEPQREVACGTWLRAVSARQELSPPRSAPPAPERSMPPRRLGGLRRRHDPESVSASTFVSTTTCGPSSSRGTEPPRDAVRASLARTRSALPSRPAAAGGPSPEWADAIATSLMRQLGHVPLPQLPPPAPAVPPPPVESNASGLAAAPPGTIRQYTGAKWGPTDDSDQQAHLSVRGYLAATFGVVDPTTEQGRRKSVPYLALLDILAADLPLANTHVAAGALEHTPDIRARHAKAFHDLQALARAGAQVLDPATQVSEAYQGQGLHGPGAKALLLDVVFYWLEELRTRLAPTLAVVLNRVRAFALQPGETPRQAGLRLQRLLRSVPAAELPAAQVEGQHALLQSALGGSAELHARLDGMVEMWRAAHDGIRPPFADITQWLEQLQGGSILPLTEGSTSQPAPLPKY